MSKQKIKKRKPIWVYMIIVVMTISTFAVCIQQQSNINIINQKIVETQNQIDKAQNTNNELTEELNNVSSYEYIEKLAREKLGMVKEKEIIFKDIN